MRAWTWEGEMKAAVFRGLRDLRLEEIPDPVCGPRDVVLEVQACGICGTDLHGYSVGSEFGPPGTVPGHEFSGRVVEAGAEVWGIATGDRVTAWPSVPCDRCPRCAEGNWQQCEQMLERAISVATPGAFAEYVRIPEARLGRTVFRIPDEVDWVSAATVEPLSVGLRAVDLAGPGPADTAVVLGLGMVGQCVVQGLKLRGVGRVIGVDLSPLRLETARASGADAMIDAGREDLPARVQELSGRGSATQGGSADVVFECSGTPRALRQGLHLARNAGTMVVVALYEQEATIDPNVFAMKQLRVLGSFGYRTEFAQALELLASGRVRTLPLVTQQLPLERIVEGFETQLDKQRSVKVMIRPRD
jgi:threonine dehydrogenase-like Zn-dependent dehydrogenase